MKNKMNKKMMLDALMTVLFIALMDYTFTGLVLHEIIGLAIFAFFFFHKLINFKWIKSITKRLFDPTLKVRTKIMYWLDVLLLIDVALITLSGLFISTEVFPQLFTITDRFLWVTIHHIASYSGLIAISIHVGLHWKMIMAAFRKMLHIKKPSMIRTAFVRLLAFLWIIAGIKSSFDVGMAEKLALTSDDESNNTAITDETALAGSLNAIENTEETINDTESETLKIYGKGNGNGSGDGDHDDEEHDDGEHEDDDYYYNTSSDTNITGTSNTSGTITNTVVDTAPTLDDYLGSLYCTGCSKHCPLITPQCSIGVRQAQVAENDYYTLYTAADTVSITNDTTDTTSTDPTANAAPTSDNETVEITDIEATLGDNVFADYLPIMGLYIGGAYYTIELIDKKKENKSDK